MSNRALNGSTLPSLADEFENLALNANLKHGSRRYQKARNKFIVTEFDEYFGEATKLGNWQKLCVDLGIEGPPQSITKCRKALKGTWVNIWDFLTAVKQGTRVKTWRSEKELAAYTLREGKLYPKSQAKANGPIRALLVHVF